MTKRTTLYLVRHGETDYNRSAIMQGRRIDSELNSEGRRQASALRDRMAEVKLDAIFSSTLRRALQTASIIAEVHEGVALTTMRDLEEMSWGDYDGFAPGAGVEAAYRRWASGDYAYAVPGGESILDVRERGLRAMRQILDASSGQKVLVVTHGRFLRVILASLLPEFGLSRMEELRHSNTGVNEILFNGSDCEAHLLNCTAHLNYETEFSLN